MTRQTEQARVFAALHTPGSPLVLHNIWDAGSANAVSQAGAKALATGSWSVAAAQGYEDGEKIPLELLLVIVERIVATVALPLSVDIEGGYGSEPASVAATVARLIDAGAIGINVEDGMQGRGGLYAADAQAARIRAIRDTADARNVPLFINARTDLFLQAADASEHVLLMEETLARAEAYREAGADGLFVPGLLDEGLIASLCEASPIPVNVMMMEDAPSHERLAACGVARISYGPMPFVKTMQSLKDAARSN